MTLAQPCPQGLFPRYDQVYRSDERDPGDEVGISLKFLTRTLRVLQMS